MATWGVVKQAHDTMKQNRAMLGKKKTARELYREEIENTHTTLENVNLHDLKERVAARIKRNQVHEFASRSAAVFFILLLVSGVAWIFISLNATSSTIKHIDRVGLFVTRYNSIRDNCMVKTEYYHRGPKAAESFYCNSVQHGESISFYENGAKFRVAQYDHGTLVSETYLYKEGDTIKSFPHIRDNDVHVITITDNARHRRLIMEFYDGKIIEDSYVEQGIAKL
jgi:hypothetical protein